MIFARLTDQPEMEHGILKYGTAEQAILPEAFYEELYDQVSVYKEPILRAPPLDPKKAATETRLTDPSIKE